MEDSVLLNLLNCICVMFVSDNFISHLVKPVKIIPYSYGFQRTLPYNDTIFYDMKSSTLISVQIKPIKKSNLMKSHSILVFVCFTLWRWFYFTDHCSVFARPIKRVLLFENGSFVVDVDVSQTLICASISVLFLT